MAGLPLKEGRVHACRRAVAILRARSEHLVPWKAVDVQGSASRAGWFCQGCVAVVLTKQLQTLARESKFQ